MKKLISLLAIVTSCFMHAWDIKLVNTTNSWIKVNVGGVAKPGSFHVALNPGQTKTLMTGFVVPSWISAYAYTDNQWTYNERTIVDHQNIQDVGSCSGHRTITIYDKSMACNGLEAPSLDHENPSKGTDW